jgi:Protein of unknown function (DUF1212).
MLEQIAYAFFATISFAVVFNVPRDELISNGICGALGWLCYLAFYKLSGSKVMASFIASIIVAIAGEVYARLHKKPVTMFIIPALIMLVPGAGCYYTMISILQQKYKEAVSYGIETGTIALAIAAGLLLVSSFVKILKIYKKAG